MTAHQSSSTGRSTALLAISLALSLPAALFGFGCGGDEGESTAGGAYQQLGVQLQNCANDALTCLATANCDDTAEQACRDGFRTCREDTRAAYRAFFESVRQCWSTKLECVAAARDAGDDTGGADETADGGAPSAHAVCREAFHACIDDNRPIRPEPGPCMQALRECVQTDVQTGRRERHRLIRDCLGEAHQCILDRLPMCGPDEPPAEDAGTAPAAP
jgi:hypothetical protein